MEKFIVSARKYRPLTFESVVGQNHITSTLRNAIVRGKVAHAYLFCGPRGVGKTTCARILSKSINCLTPQEDGEACGKCESCVAFSESRSFNIHELDAASNNSVENIRSLNEQVRIAPQIGRYSVYIIDEAHMLSTAAFNAFLKTLEEPPAHAIFILATTEKHKILPTILSRCQIYDFKRIKVEDTVRFLQYISEKEGITSDDESLHIIAQKADGCMRDALSMYDKVVSFCGSSLQFHDVAEALNVLDYDSYFTFTSYITSGDYGAALLQFDSILQKGFEAMTFLAGLSGHLRNLLIAADGKTMPLLEVTGTIAQRYIAQAKKTPASYIFDALSIIATAEGTARTSLNIRLHAEITILKLCNLSPLKLSVGSVNTAYTLPKISDAPSQNGAATVTAMSSAVQTTPIPAPPQPATPKVEQKLEPTKVTPIKPEVIEPQPQVRVQEPQTEVAEPVKKRRTKGKSLLGVSINSMMSEASIPKVVDQPKDGDENGEITKAIIPFDKCEQVLAGLKSYAENLRERRPRLAEAFSRCTIVDGVIQVTVPNNILQDELNNNRHAIIEAILPFCGVDKLSFDVVVDHTIEPEKKILLKDEDKYKFLVSENKSVATLCKSLDLDYI